VAEAGAPPDRVEPPSVENLAEARRAVEAMLLVASDPTPVQLLAQLVELPVDVVQSMCRELAAEYERERRGFMLVEVAGGWRYQTHPDTHAYVERFALEGIPNRLSTAALETLAIVAYKQPISRGQIGAIRGVNVDGVLRTLVQRGYVDEQGRDDGPGQATLFGTTQYFLEQLGLMSLDDLPPLGDFVPSAEVLEALEQTLKVGPDEIDLTDAGDADAGDAEAGDADAGDADADAGDAEAETPVEPVVEESESLPEPIEASEADQDPVFEVVTDAVEVVDRSVEPEVPEESEESFEVPTDDTSEAAVVEVSSEDSADSVVGVEAAVEEVESDPVSGLVLGGVVDAVVDAGVHNGHVETPREQAPDLPEPVEASEEDEIDIDPESGSIEAGGDDDPAAVVEVDPVDVEDVAEEPAEPGTDLMAAGEWLDEADEVLTDDGDEDDLDPDEGGMELEVAAESQVEETLGPDAIGAPSVDDAERFRGPGDGPSPPDAPAAGIVPGPGTDHGLGERAYDPSAEEGLAAWPLNGHGPSGNGNGHRPTPGTGDA
jgi:segregation and condensation protein B